jgi:hypothetical protein
MMFEALNPFRRFDIWLTDIQTNIFWGNFCYFLGNFGNIHAISVFSDNFGDSMHRILMCHGVYWKTLCIWMKIHDP